MINLPMLKDIYVYLQSKSQAYPYIDVPCFMKHFIKEVDLAEKNLLTSAAISTLVLETAV